MLWMNLGLSRSFIFHNGASYRRFSVHRWFGSVPTQAASFPDTSIEPSYPLPETRRAIDKFRKDIQGQLILAPLSRGGNLPFRRLCAGVADPIIGAIFECSDDTNTLSYLQYFTLADFGANFTMSEMAYGKNLASHNAITQRNEK